jgi:hypothetical protein
MNTVSMFSMFLVLVYFHILHVSGYNGKVTVLTSMSQVTLGSHVIHCCVAHCFFVCLISKHLSYQNKDNTAEFYDQALENYDSMSVSTDQITTTTLKLLQSIIR